MRRILRPLRLFGVVIVVASFLTAMSLVWLVVRNRWKRVRVSNKLLSYWGRFACWVLGIRRTVFGLEHLRGLNGALFVGNHLTYTDVTVIASHLPTCFVTSTEIKRSIGLGQICMMAGCLFVDRKNKRNLVNEVGEIEEGLRNGLNVAIFPEATSTNGEKILRFRKPLYYSAVTAGVPVVPFILNYRTIGGAPVTLANRDNVFWYGDMDFIPHLWRLTGEGGAEVELTFLAPIPTTAESDTTELAEHTQALVESVYIPIK